MDVRRRLVLALRRDALVLLLLYAVPFLRPYRRWYWRLVGLALLLGAAWGLVARLLSRRRNRTEPQSELSQAAQASRLKG